MFKEDGSEIRNPRRVVDAIKANGYTEPLFTKDGDKIKDPLAFMKKLDLPGDAEKAKPGQGIRRKQTDSPRGGEAIMFKADGTPINNPERYVASLQKNGYSDPLFTARGTEIRDPASFLAAQNGGSRARDEAPPAKRARTAGPGAGKGSGKSRSGGAGAPALPDFEGLYKADGSLIKNPVGYVAAIERNGYTQPVFTAQGQEIRNPSGYIARAGLTAGSAKGQGKWVKIEDKAPAQPDYASGQSMYKADGTRIAKPSAYVASIEKNGYNEPLYTADGQEIRNPAAYVSKMQNQGPVPNAPKKQAGAADVQMFKANGQQIKKPEAYVASIEKNGYTDPLFTADGEEIRNPVQYLENGRRGAGAAPAKQVQKQGAPRKQRMVPRKTVKAPRGARPNGAEERQEGLYKEDGSRIKNPAAYVANFEQRGQSQTLLNARGQVVKNPAAYVARMMENEGQQPAGKGRRPAGMAAKGTGGKISYYGKPGSGTLADRLKTALSSGMRARSAQTRRGQPQQQGAKR